MFARKQEVLHSSIAPTFENDSIKQWRPSEERNQTNTRYAIEARRAKISLPSNMRAVPFYSAMLAVLAWSTLEGLADPSASKSLIILKNPRSGSSYFVHLLNSYPTVHITDDILTPHSWRYGNLSADYTQYLASALHEPVMRYDIVKGRSTQEVAAVARRRKHFYGDDEAGGKRWANGYDLVGFSICPSMHAFDLDLEQLARLVPRAYLVIYIRTNKVKQAVAQLRGETMKARCGSATSKGARENCGGGLPQTISINTADLALALGNAFYREEHLLQKALRLSRAFQTEVIQISYESLLGAPEPTMASLFKFLGLERVFIEGGSEEPAESFNGIDDLRSVIENYDEVQDWLTATAPCLLPHLNSTRPSTVHRLPECRDAFADEMKYQERMHRDHWEATQIAPKLGQNRTRGRSMDKVVKLRGKQLTKHRNEALRRPGGP